MSTSGTTIQHVAGSAFGLHLHSTDCPISDGQGIPVDTADWDVSLLLVLKDRAKVEISGRWTSSAGPWGAHFASNETTAWEAGAHDVRLKYRSPDNRTFVQPIPIVIEVIR